MVSIPSFILRRLYVKGSLRNTDTGVEFQILNKLGSGQARRLLPLTVDDRELPLESCAFHLEDDVVSFQEVTKEKPFAMALNKATVITAHGVYPERRFSYYRHGLRGGRPWRSQVRFRRQDLT